MVGLAFLATVLNYVHRLSFNYLSADRPLRELIPDDAFGYLDTAFFVAYMVSIAFSGFVIDKLGTRLGYALCMGFWIPFVIADVGNIIGGYCTQFIIEKGFLFRKPENG